MNIERFREISPLRVEQRIEHHDEDVGEIVDARGFWLTGEEAELVANMANALPELLAVLKPLMKEVRELQDALSLADISDDWSKVINPVEAMITKIETIDAPAKKA